MDFEVVATGFCLLEAPRADGGDVWFTEVLQGGIWRLSPDGRLDTWLPERRWIGRIVLNRDGAVLCSGGDGIAWLDPATGASGVLLDRIAGFRSGAIARLAPDGRIDRRAARPVEDVTSLCFGGAGRRDLYVTTAVPGFAEALMQRVLPPGTASL